MLNLIVKKIFGTQNNRELKKLQPLVDEINALEAGIKSLSDGDLKAKTGYLKQKLEQGATLDDILPEAFAVVREASMRTLKMRHFDVQLVGGIVLHRGKIAEMKTGEGKTLVATLPVYLNALTGKGAHVVTVNDYLARRDSEWMGEIYKFLGMSVGVIVHGLTDQERQAAYGSDITYGTNNEFGFDYLRDNMKYDLKSYVQREHNYAIVDEVDSILIDEARTPLIISGQSEDSTDKYYSINSLIPKLSKESDYTIDEKAKTSILTEVGVTKVEKILGVENLFDPANMETLHHVNQALKAHTMFKRDVDYVVKDGEVMIVDEFTGRLMPGRRWSDGLHQAVEAKEGVKIESENQTLATVTFQNFFRMYGKLAGMTGTADTEAAEFAKIYNLDVMIIPTNETMIRKDHSDVIYKTEHEKFHCVVEDIKECHKRGQPVLVGTISIEKSEVLSGLLKRQGVRHNVLNAKHHEKEAEIVAQAGRFEAVTISTNMAGRGTDIVLGGNPVFLAKMEANKDEEPEKFAKALEELKVKCADERKKVLEQGGLYILGTERHEARRIDNQLRGRSGRQGDPGMSRFYLSLEDDLLRIFGSERIQGMMNRLGMEENEPIIHPWISKAIENAQKRVEGHNFEIRKHLLDYDDVLNKQRQTVYGLRKEILAGETIRDKVLDLADEAVSDFAGIYVTGKKEETDFKGLSEHAAKLFGEKINFEELSVEKWGEDSVGEWLFKRAEDIYKKREEKYSPEIMRHVEKVIMLSTLDALWKDHLLNMDHLREGIGLRGYGQKDPLLEYKREGFGMFQEMLARFRDDVLEKLFHVQIAEEKGVRPLFGAKRGLTPFSMGRGAAPVVGQGSPSPSPPPEKRGTFARHGEKVGRNNPCPCGAKHADGRPMKYKQCHGR